MMKINWQQSTRQLVAVHDEHTVAFADDLTIDEAKRVIVELLEQFGLVKTHTVGETPSALAKEMQE